MEVALLAFLILLNGLFAMSEMALSASRKARLQVMVEAGESGAQAAIELHDLPAPPGNDYTQCPNVPPDRDVCTRESRFRGEARNTIEKWHALTPAQQLQVVRFLLSL